MARSKRSTRTKKIEPAVMTLSFQLPLAPFETNTQSYIDLSQVASVVNRRFYRQGLNWAVGSMKFLTSSSYKGSVGVFKLPNTWTMSNSWEKGFRTWQRMNNEALEEAESVRPRFLDYKVYMCPDHHQKGSVNNLMPYNVSYSPVLALNDATPGEWEMSKMEIPDAPFSLDGGVQERDIIATGPNYPGPSPVTGLDAVSLIEGYANSRGLPNVLDPNTPDDAALADGIVPENWMSATFNEGTQQTEEVLEALITDNNIAPYPFENDGVNPDTMYPGGTNQLTGAEIHSTEFISGTTVGGTTRIKGGNFPCGLIGISQYQDAEGGPYFMTLEIDLIPGNHRGYLCEPMTEM